MAKLNSARLIGQWQAEKHSLVQPTSLPDTQWILEAIFGDVPTSTATLNIESVETLINNLFEWRRSDNRPITYRQARKRVNRVLEQLNQIPGMQAVLMPEPIQTHRPSAWPTTARALAISEQMVQFDQKILGWCRQAAKPDAWLLVLATRLMTRLGMGETTALGTLAMLTREHISQRWWAIPAAPGEQLPDGGHYRVRLPDDIWVPLRVLLTREKKKAPTAWLLALTEPDVRLDHRQRVKKLRTRLKAATQQCLKELKQHADSNKWSRLRSWSSLTSASLYVPVLRGVPPLWARMLRQYPLPTCTPVPLLSESGEAHWYSPGEQYGRLPDRTISQRGPSELPQLGQQTRPAGLAVIATDHLPIDWSRRAKNILQQFLADARQLGKGKLNAERLEKPIQEMLLRHEKKLVGLIGHSGSYPQWVLHFLYHQLRTQGNKLSTARTQLSRLTPITMMLHDAVLDLSEWDDDVVLELQEAATSGANWSNVTQAAFYKAMRQFMAFCQQYGVLEGVHLPRNATSLAPSVLRTRILSPDHMETVWNSLINHVPAGDPRQMMALVIALGFYGGLRASEVLSLTLNNVVMSGEEDAGSSVCWIEIEGGKTSAARRRVALHVMAPPSVIQQMQIWINNRRKECSSRSLSDIALFGPRHSPDAFTRESLITPVIAWMRYVLGEDIDFHGLRHAAASWTLLRLHAAQKPAFKATLHHRHHWIFCDKALNATLAHFCGAEGDDTLARGTQFLHVAKWIGHRDAGTLLQHYAHVLGLLHSDVIAPRGYA